MNHMTDPNLPVQPRENVMLTPEEIRILKECAREGIVQRAIPLGIVFGVGGFMLARSGALHHRVFGAMPTTIGFSVFGYLLGRFTYSKVCLQRVMQVPDGTIRKMFPQNENTPRDTLHNSQFHTTVEIPKTDDSLWDTVTPNSDIDVASTGSFDTVPSDYYQPLPENSEQKTPSQNFTSYDDLRKQNREQFSNKYRVQPQPAPQDRFYQRRPLSQDAQPSDLGKKQTKYGDTWD